MTAHQAFRKAYEILKAYDGFVPEANEGYNDANRAIISELAKEHNNKIVLFKFWPFGGGKGAVEKFDPSKPIYNFCADYVVPEESEHFKEFIDLVEEFRRDGISNKLVENMYDTVRACGGYPVYFC